MTIMIPFLVAMMKLPRLIILQACGFDFFIPNKIELKTTLYKLLKVPLPTRIVKRFNIYLHC